MDSSIKFLITVEFRYSSIPQGDSRSPFQVERCRYTVCDNVQDAVEKGEEVLELLRKEGYKNNVSFKLDDKDSYRYTVRCYAKGCEAIVRIEDFGTCSTDHIVNMAKISIDNTKKYVEWLLKEE